MSRKNFSAQICALLLALAGGTSIACLSAATVARFPAPAVQTGMLVSASGHYLTVDAGTLYVDDTPVTIASRQRLHVPATTSGALMMATLFATKDGALSIATSKPAKFAPEPPPAPTGTLALAHIVVHGTAALTDDDVLPIIRDASAVLFSDRGHNLKALSRTIAKLRAHQSVRVMFWGDSVTAGANASAPEFCFASLTEKGLREHFQVPGLVAKNFGVGGTTATERIGKLDSQVRQFKPDVMIIEFINDLRTKGPDLEAVYGKVKDIVDDYDVEVIYIDPFLPSPLFYGVPKSPDATNEFVEESKRPYFQFVRQKTTEYGWALADCTRRWTQLPEEGLRPGLVLDDGLIHPNNCGHRMMSEEVLKCFN